jgi:hypothetical protein
VEALPKKRVCGKTEFSKLLKEKLASLKLGEELAGGLL